MIVHGMYTKTTVYDESIYGFSPTSFQPILEPDVFHRFTAQTITEQRTAFAKAAAITNSANSVQSRPSLLLHVIH
ncbi:hypothetical protein SAMN05518848_108140 [Paenibacillus sp. PDC88]|nr:hypothetical protein SAMN05518848_108140 [Paenibacillus sp. PDC88]